MLAPPLVCDSPQPQVDETWEISINIQFSFRDLTIIYSALFFWLCEFLVDASFFIIEH